MTKTQSHRSHRYPLNARTVLVAVISLLLFSLLLSSVIRLFLKYRSIRTHIKDLRTEEISLSKKKAALIETNSHIQTPQGQEQLFRDKYRLVKPGEGIIVVTKEDTPPSEVVQSDSSIGRLWNTLLRALGIR